MDGVPKETPKGVFSQGGTWEEEVSALLLSSGRCCFYFSLSRLHSLHPSFTVDFFFLGSQSIIIESDGPKRVRER